jgi:cyclopropane fatty-acyl-phospholipid synthase-like methyltransferase
LPADDAVAETAGAHEIAAARSSGHDAPIDLETYYTEAGMDYRAWSPGFNMHFGYWRPWMNPFALERMLEQMSREVFRRLDPADGDRVLDLGCGVGAPARALVATRAVTVTAVTKVQWQIDMARRLGAGTATPGTVDWTLGDYTDLDLPAASFQGAFSIEASCHAAGAAKEPFVRECARLLAPGARLVVADGFMKKSRGIPRWYQGMLDRMTHSWAVERFADLEAFTRCLERHGLEVEAVEDISYRIAPSALHVPRVTLAFLVRELLVRRRWLNRARWGHVIACVISPFIGLGRSWFGYYLVTARKRQGAVAAVGESHAESTVPSASHGTASASRSGQD